MTPVWVDTRWEGVHGIGRYAREVCSRLTVPWNSLGLDGAPTSPLGALAKVPPGLVYSPGYNGFRGADRQVLTLHDLIHLETPWPMRAKYVAYYEAVIKPIVKRTRVVITVSETSRRAIADWIGNSSVEVVNAGLGASPAFHPDIPSADDAAAASPYLMYVGNLRRHKNVHVVLNAMTRVPDARLRMLVPPRERDRARSLVTALGLEGRVTLLSRLSDDDLAAQYRGAAATVMPSTVEGFGLPALESVMTGTPVLFWTGCAAVAETAAERGTAIESASDADEWAERIEDALASRNRVEPPANIYKWDATAACVDATLRRSAH